MRVTGTLFSGGIHLLMQVAFGFGVGTNVLPLSTEAWATLELFKIATVLRYWAEVHLVQISCQSERGPHSAENCRKPEY